MKTKVYSLYLLEINITQVLLQQLKSNLIFLKRHFINWFSNCRFRRFKFRRFGTENQISGFSGPSKLRNKIYI
jgi:hypothetical protein